MTSPDDYAMDTCADDDPYILELLEDERKWRVIANFKEFISKEPEFGAIKNLSSQTILNIIETTSFDENTKDYPEFHIEFLSDLINGTRYEPYDTNFVKNVYENIYNKMYI
tara:strand:- start:1721 stop:2053 length:333 start_codon:yes stop_codon:yes gene_type:complete